MRMLRMVRGDTMYSEHIVLFVLMHESVNSKERSRRKESSYTEYI